MPDTSLYIWYHADPDLEPELRNWIVQVGDVLGYGGSLFRRDTPGKTTFMEVYEHVTPEAAARIENLAAGQSWITKLHSPRRCEAFMPVLHT
jgi:hypothetical protein